MCAAMAAAIAASIFFRLLPFDSRLLPLNARAGRFRLGVPASGKPGCWWKWKRRKMLVAMIGHHGRVHDSLLGARPA